MQKHLKQIIVCIAFALLLFTGCKKGNNDTDKPLRYIAENGKIKGILDLNIVGTEFYGRYEIVNGVNGSDIGQVRGKIKGDTLIGNYYYKPWAGTNKKRIPIALLKKEGYLLEGKGVVVEFVNIPHFSPDIPIDFSNPRFIFIPVTDTVSIKK